MQSCKTVLFHSAINRQGYGALYNVSDKEEDDEINEENEIKSFIKLEEEFELVRFNNIIDVVNRFPDYKKISRFNKDNEYYKTLKDF
jgi:hypothetical protein